MLRSNKNDKSGRSTRQLAGMIARMPTVDAPSDLTEGVMRRIQPKKTVPAQTWIRRFKMYMTMPPMRGWGLVGTTAALIIVGLIAIRAYNDGRETISVDSAISDAGKTQVVLALNWPSAQKVAVIGSFNQWDPAGYQMHRKSPDGQWMINLQLEQGRHTYAFLIDDHTVVADPHSLWQQDDGFGNRNSSIIVDNGKQNANHI